MGVSETSCCSYMGNVASPGVYKQRLSIKSVHVHVTYIMTAYYSTYLYTVYVLIFIHIIIIIVRFEGSC